MESYKRLENPRLYVAFYEQVFNDDGTLSDGDLASPTDSIQIIIADPTGTVVQALTAMTVYNAETGKYYYDGYTIPADAETGTWHYECRGKSGTKLATGAGNFEVSEEIA